MKKIISIILIFSVVVIFVPQKKVSAASSDASSKGFKIEGFNYVNDITTDFNYLKGQKLDYGAIRMWSALYSYHDVYNDEKIFLVLFQLEVEPSTFKDAIKSFSSRSMKLNVESTTEVIRLQASYPNSDNNNDSYSISTSITVDGEFGTEESKISIGTSWSRTENLKEVEIKNFNHSKSNRMEYNFNFTRYNKNIRTSPYQGNYKQNGALYFVIEDYQDYVQKNKNEKIILDYTGYIFKNHWLTDQTASGSLRSEYIIN